MARLGLAFRMFWRVLRDKDMAGQAPKLLDHRAVDRAEAVKEAAPPRQAAPPRPEGRSDALSLLEVLQREARLVDFLKEPIAGYGDAQIGAAVRDVHRDAAAALERMFALRPVMEQAEGVTVDLPVGFDAARVRLVGNVAGPAPYRGALRHPGWQATRVQLPEWSGSAEAAKVIAPAEVEVK